MLLLFAPFRCWSILQLQFIFTDHIRRMGEGNVFSLCVSLHLDGRGVPHPRGLDGGGVTPSQVQMGVSHPADGGGGLVEGYLHPADRRGTPIQDHDRGTWSRTGWWFPPIETEWGTPPVQDWMGYPPYSPHQETDQHSEHLLCAGWYASCIHAGGLSC